jgi:hypothetical protein
MARGKKGLTFWGIFRRSNANKNRDGEGQRKKKSKTWAIFLAGGLKLHSKKQTRNRGITKNPVIRAIRIYLTIFSFREVTICYPKDWALSQF